jgi:2-polyprenyl-3-methyl-5-hydroxy-6-metoxy-1,4-benzoquinol methylase
LSTKTDAGENGANFDKFAPSYRELLDCSISITGESGDYFARVKSRYAASVLGEGFAVNLLDFGCGIGLLSCALARQFPTAGLDGFDSSRESIAAFDPELAKRGRFTSDPNGLRREYDAILVANVMHHIPPAARSGVVSSLAQRLSPEGRLFIFEHNPTNPLTRRAVDRCEFDADAVLLPARETLGYFSPAGMQVIQRHYIVFFPRWLKALRRLETRLAWCPLGAQYVVVGKRAA